MFRERAVHRPAKLLVSPVHAPYPELVRALPDFLADNMCL